MSSASAELRRAFSNDSKMMFSLYDTMERDQIGLDRVMPLLRKKGDPMPGRKRRSPLRLIIVAGALATFACPAAYAKDSSAYVKEAQQYIEKGDLKAAELELRNAIREAPQDPLLRARLADVYLRLGDSLSAEREARAARERNGNQADYLPVLADALLGQQKFANLIELVQPGNRDPVLESKVRTALGTAAAGLGDRAKAETLLGEAVKFDPNAARPKIQLARLLGGTKPAEADKLIDEVIAANPRSAEALQIKGEMLASRADHEGAMRLFNEALKIDPKNVAARLSRADVNIALGKYKLADEDIDSVLKVSPGHLMANYLRGAELSKQEKYAEADRIFDRLSPDFAGFWPGYYAQGVTKFKLGQYAQAETSLRKYLAKVPDNIDAARLIATAALQQQAASRAIAYLKPLADKMPADAAALAVLGEAYMADQKPDLALHQFQKAAALDPDNPAIKTQIGISEIGAGQREQGLATLEQVFGSEAGAPVAGPALVVTEVRERRLDKAVEVAVSLIERDARNPVYQTLLGIVRAAQQDFPAAESAFRAALAVDPKLSAATRDLAQVYMATGRTDEARNLYSDLLAKNPNEVGALLGLADTYIAQRKWTEAIDAINRARTATPNDPSPGLKLIGIYQRRQDWTNAKAVAAELAAQFPSDANILDIQGQAQLAADDTNGAISSFKRAYALAPNSVPIRSRYLAALVSAKYFTEARGVLQEAVARDPQNSLLKADLIRAEGEVNGLDTAVAKARALATADPGNNIYDLVLAELYETAGRPRDAIAVLEKAAAAKPSDEGLAIALAQLYYRSGDFSKAEGILAPRLKADPNSRAVSTVMAQQYWATGRAQDAKQLFRNLVAREPNDVVALLGLAEIAMAERNWPEARDYLNHARTAAPTDPAPGIALVNLELARQDSKDATTTANQIAEQFSDNFDVLQAKARAQIAARDSAGATATYKLIYGLFPNSVPAMSGYVARLKEAKEFSQAETILQAALVRYPKSAAVKAEVIRVVADIGGMRAGLAKARSFAGEDPGNPLYDIVSAELYEKAGRRDDSVDLLEKAIAARPADNALIAALSGLYVRTGDPGKAEAVLNARLQAVPNDVTIRSALASLYLQQNKYDNAIDEYTRIILEHQRDAAALNDLAWLYQQKGDLLKARRLAEQAAAVAPRTPRIDDTLGWILLAQGEADEALTYLSAASLLAPEIPDIQFHLAVALNRLGRAADAQATLERLLGSGVTFSDRAEAEKLLQLLKRG
jgi:putative PEP-CTERM system TPR-repeat lipoprotein